MTTATDVTTFDDLSPEVVLCILEFLSPSDRYNAFFDSNSRLRSLVKKWTQYSRKNLIFYIRSFSTRHSWYKHLDFENGGTIWFIYPCNGQQSRDCDYSLASIFGLHWHFIYHENIEDIVDERVRAIITRHPFRLNPFFYNEEQKHPSSVNKSSRYRSFHGGHIILSRYKSVLKTWLSSNYPDYVATIFKDNDSNETFYYDREEKLAPIYDGEWSKAMISIYEAADQVWNELRDLDDVNPCNLKY